MIRLVAVLLCMFTAPFAIASTVITGKLTGANGTHPEVAHVHLALSATGRPVKTIAVEKDGSYRMETENQYSSFVLQFTAASHKMEIIPMLAGNAEHVEVYVRLQPNTVPDTIRSVAVISDLNNYNFSSGAIMQKQPDGTYTTVLKSDKPTLSYQLLIDSDRGTAQRSINGTMYNRLQYDGGGDYLSVVDVKNGEVTIVFDPGKMASATAPAVVQFGSGNILLEKFSMNARDVQTWKSTITVLAGEADRTPASDKELQRGLSEMAVRIGEEQDAEARQLLLLLYLDLANMGRLSRKKPDPVIARAFREIPPESPIWDYEPRLIYTMVSVADTHDIDMYRTAMLKASVSPKIRRTALVSLVSLNFQLGRDEEGLRYSTMLFEEFPKSQEAYYVRNEWNPDRAIKVGKQVPAFSIVSLDGATTYTNENMKGKYYLIDFWATWCGPCVKEMGHLHEVYEKYKGGNFEILSLSFDGKPEDIAKFRSKKWTMPWSHSFVDGGFNSDLGKSFEVNGIPKPILVDPSGVILAIGNELRGEDLALVLAKFLTPIQAGTR